MRTCTLFACLSHHDPLCPHPTPTPYRQCAAFASTSVGHLATISWEFPLQLVCFTLLSCFDYPQCLQGLLWQRLRCLLCAPRCICGPTGGQSVGARAIAREKSY